VKPKTIIDGVLTKAQMVKKGGLVTRAFIRFHRQGNDFLILKGDTNPVGKNIADADTSNMSGAEAIAKVGGMDVIIPAGIFAGLGFAIGSILGENKIQLTLGGAVIGGLIGISKSGGAEEKLNATGEGKKRCSQKVYDACIKGGSSPATCKSISCSDKGW
jgi:hypothetical protein